MWLIHFVSYNEFLVSFAQAYVMNLKHKYYKNEAP